MKKKLLCTALAAVMVLGLCACGGDEQPAGDNNGESTATGAAFKLGGTGPLTGSAAIYGVAAKNGGDLSQVLHTVFFSPEDLFLIREGAAARRRFMDMSLCQLRPRYAEALAEYPAYYEEQNGEALDQELYNIMAAPADVLDRCELYVNLPQETLKYYDKLWTQLGV